MKQKSDFDITVAEASHQIGLSCNDFDNFANFAYVCILTYFTFFILYFYDSMQNVDVLCCNLILIAEVPPACAPERNTPFIAATSMSRYEGVRQCGTSTTLRVDGRVPRFFPSLPVISKCFGKKESKNIKNPFARKMSYTFTWPNVCGQ